MLDLIVQPVHESQPLDKQGGGVSLNKLGTDPSDSVVSSFLEQCLHSAERSQETIIVRFMFSSVPGYAVRSDSLVQRFELCEGIKRVESFVSPLEKVPNVPFQSVDPSTVPKVLQYAVGAMLIPALSHKSLDAEISRLNHEFINRLSFPWLQHEPVPHRRIAWVQGRENVGVSRRAYEAARALGVSIVMIDNPGHWLEDNNGPHANLREAFIPTNIEVDQGFPGRIVHAVRNYPYPIDGLMTISDVRLPGVAQACEVLGLPTSPETAYQIAGNKARTRMLEDSAVDSMILSSAAELKSLLQSGMAEQLEYPLVVKPCLGWNSDCVAKVQNQNELTEAVLRASARHANAASPSVGVIIEPYIDGPEVDANIVLLDGAVVYFEIEDDFPTKGDAASGGIDDNFQETQVLLPSGLPEDEVVLLCNSLHRSILRQGFTSGVFHCEARIQNSSMCYVNHNGVLDMQEKEDDSLKDRSAKKKSVYLHEINARPPGYLESVAVKLVHGVDYYALRILLSLGSAESDRLHALSKPFLNGPQFDLCILIIPQTGAGIMKTEDAGADLLERHPELSQYVPDFDTYLKRGDVLKGPSAESLWWVANFSVISRTGRQDCLRRARFIQDNFVYELE